MKKTLDSSVVRAVMGLLVLALGIGSARVVVSSAEVDEQNAAPMSTTSSTVQIPAHLGSIAGMVAGQELLAPGATDAVRSDAEIEDLLAAQSAGTASSSSSSSSTVPSDSTTTTEIAELESTTSTTTAPLETTTTTAPPATTTTTSPPETTTTTSPPETTTTTSPPETTTTTVASGGYTGVLSEAEALELFSMYFSGSDLDTAMRVAACESSYNTDAYNPAGYGGLFQHGIDFWPERAASAGWGGASIFDGEANTAVAAWLVSVNGGWSDWPGC